VHALNVKGIYKIKMNFFVPKVTLT
jgi:hypothetical protein